MFNVATATTFQITNTKLYVPVVTLPTKENIKLTKLLSKGFKGSIFVLAYDNTDNGNKRVERNSNQKYFLPKVNLTKFNVLIDGRNFYDQPISNEIRKYDELRKLITGKGNDLTTGCLLDYKYYKQNFQN